MAKIKVSSVSAQSQDARGYTPETAFSTYVSEHGVQFALTFAKQTSGGQRNHEVKFYGSVEDAKFVADSIYAGIEAAKDKLLAREIDTIHEKANIFYEMMFGSSLS